MHCQLLFECMPLTVGTDVASLRLLHKICNHMTNLEVYI